MAVLWDPSTWADKQFSECQLGDQRRNKRLRKLAVQATARPDGSTPDQTETWADLKGAYRLFDSDDVSFQAIIEPHCRQTRAACQPGDVKLIVNDTTELNFTTHSQTEGLGPTGNGGQRGFFLHSALLLDPRGAIGGLAGQEIFYRPPTRSKRAAKNTRRRDPQRETAVWGRLIDRVGRPPEGVRWLHVCDRGADDYEVLLRALAQGCGFVIRAAKLHRNVHTREGHKLPLAHLLATWKSRGTRAIQVQASKRQPARTARCELRYGPVWLPQPSVTNAWIREHAPHAPLCLWVVELRETSPPKGCQPIRWVLYTTEAVEDAADAERVCGYYERRWTIEDYHKCLKTGCRVESRQYATAARLERITGLLAVVALRLLQMRTAALEQPARAACEVAPAAWVGMLQAVRKLPNSGPLSIRDFVRHLAGLGGHMLRKSDGDPGWITLWRGYEKLQLMLRGAIAARKKCG